MVNLGDYDGAAQMIRSIEDYAFFAPHQRLLAIGRLLFHYRQNPDHENIAHAAIGFLFAKSKEVPVKLSTLTFHLGEAVDSVTAAQPIVPTLARYIVARFLLRSEKAKEALKEIDLVLAYSHLLPDIVAREALLMKAQALEKLAQKPQALTELRNLLASADLAGEKLYLQDSIDRITFAIGQ